MRRGGSGEEKGNLGETRRVEEETLGERVRMEMWSGLKREASPFMGGPHRGEAGHVENQENTDEPHTKGRLSS